MSTLAGAVHLNGRVVAASRARISVFDRGFLYGDGVFETVRTYRGAPFLLAAHLERLRASCTVLGIGLPTIDWEGRISALLARTRLKTSDTAVRITVTRGIGRPGVVPPASLTPTILITASPIDPELKRLQRRGARAIVLPFGRDGFLAEHKTLDYLPGVVGKTLAARHRAFEGLYVAGNGDVTEGTTSNLFAVRGNRLLTPPVCNLLPGVTRRFVMNLAAEADIRVEERALRAPALRRVDEAFLTSAVVEVLPIARIDDQAIGDGRAGPVTQRVQHLYRRAVAQVRPGTAK